MSKKAKEINDIILGDGDLYIAEYEGGAIPSHEDIEKPENAIGHSQGGTTIEYKSEVKKIKNQHNKTVKMITKGEEVTFKTGILTWALENLSMLSMAKIETETNKKTLTIGGKSGLKTVLLRFVHTKEDGKKLRFTMIAQAGNGFKLDFNDEELVVDAEFEAIERVKDVLAIFEEEIGE